MNFLAISGSLRASSTNTAILRAAAERTPPAVTVTLYDGLDDLPHFSPDRDGENPPASVIRLRTVLRDADAILVCTPEYAHGIPGVLKNMLDWTVSSGEFVDKPVGVISAGPSDTGGARAHESLVQTLTVLMAQLSPNTSLTIPFVRKKLNADGELTDPTTIRELEQVMISLVQAVRDKSLAG